MTATKTSPSVPLTEAAHELGVPYLKARDLVLRGDLEGEKRGARWLVSAQSLAAFREREGD